MDLNSFLAGDYLSQHDMAHLPAGSGKTFKIISIETENVGGEEKPVMHAENLPKPMVLNKTNVKTLISICGTSVTHEMVGKIAEVYVDSTVRNPSGSLVGGLRIRPRMVGGGISPEQAPGTQPPGGGAAGAPGQEDVPW